MRSVSSTAPTPSLTRRMACWLYEGMLLFGVVFFAGFVFSTTTQTHDGLEHRHALQGFVFLVIGLYFTWFWHKGQTLAMRTWHIRITDTRGAPITKKRALVRYLFSWVWFLPPLAIMAPFGLSGSEVAVLCTGWVLVWAICSRFHPERQFWHDAWAGTRLIDARPQPATS